jgi:Highly conserved protein containing a thioredoxin domain
MVENNSRTSNRLQFESSPYLLQHAHNPVDWYPWGEEAFERAINEDKPVLVSIGYAACHWCHVMERESFENEETAKVMNENFINIKVDREERPDIDHIYMDAVQSMTGGGGWPLNVFLTPDKKPFYGGTYFPPRRAFNRASWTEVLVSISEAYKKNNDEIKLQAENLTSHLKQSNLLGTNQIEHNSLFNEDKISDAFLGIMKLADKEWGGFGKAPKFPQTFTINFLLSYGFLRKNEDALQQAKISLMKMYQGGIYDHIGGGFARYSTDNEWLAPHFEKMLYDNALLVDTYSDAYSLTRNPVYKKVIDETLAFVQRELLHEKGGFYSALDADSEGEEGKFYVWSFEEVKEVLHEKTEEFCSFFDITSGGNWEGKNIPRILSPLKEQLAQDLEVSKKLLLERRNKRVRPQTDDKILLGWNALMNRGYTKAYSATGLEAYKAMAIRNMDFLLTAFKNEQGGYFHSWKNDTGKQPAFLDDYAALIDALIGVHEVTGDTSYLDKAKELTEFVIEHFSDDSTPFFYYTHAHQEDVLLRKIELFDAATPSGNSMMALNLYKLSICYDRSEWKEKAINMVRSMGELPIRYPTSFGVWLSLIHEIIAGTKEISIVGNQWKEYLGELLSEYIPYKILMVSKDGMEGYPMLAGKGQNDQTIIYLCTNYECTQPVDSIKRLISLLSVK